MPLADRTIQPIWLGRRPLSEEEKNKDVAPIAVCHNAVLGAIVQLASLVRHADDIFCDLAEECQAVFEKTESIAKKIQNVERIVTQLDSTEVKIPVGTLKEFSAVTDHHVAKHGFECDHFTPDNRPYCIRFNYSMCDVTPVHALRGADLYRKDGLCSSHLFKLWPIALRDTPVRMDEMNVPRRYVAMAAHKKRYKTLKLRERRRTIQSIEEIVQDSETSSGDLQAIKADHLSKSQPSILVPVDTSGAGFERMASFRQSLREEGDRGRDRKRRRRTVSGVPDNIMQEIEQFENSRSVKRDRPRQYSLDDLDQKDLDAKDEIMKQYLLEIDAAIEEREQMEYAEQREAKLLKFLPCRRSRSLPRCVKLIAGRNKDDLTRTSMYKKQPKLPADEVRLRQPADKAHDKFSSSASLGSISGTDKRASMSSKRSSMIGEKIKSLVTNTIKPRPKSLDFDSIEVKDESSKSESRSKSAERSSSLSRMNSPSMPEGIMSHAASDDSQIGPGTYYYFDSNTLPRAQAKKYDFPWDSLPKDWTTSVKLREISKRRKEDRQSSSGNWSQSGYSSNRQSMDSDAKSSMPSSTSQYSLGKDSGRDSPRSAGERDGLDTGYMGDAASTESISDTKSVSNTDSDDWIRSLAERAAGRGDVTSTSAEALANLSRLTKQNIRNLDILVPGRVSVRKQRNELEDDGESSVYSLDQEGFYTSFHNDSGLRKSTNTLLDEEDEDLIVPRVRESKSLQSVASYSTVESVIFRPLDKEGDDPTSSVSSPNLMSLSSKDPFLAGIQDSDIPDMDAYGDAGEGDVEYGDTGTLKAKKKSEKKKKSLPPPPPPRTSSIAKGTSSSGGMSDSKSWPNLDDSPPTSIETSSESSDQETVYARLKMKTSISAHAFPSWCPGVVSDEDDFQDRLNAESSEVEELFSSGKENWLSGTLPRSNITSEATDTNSWPRVKRSNSQQPGILKTPEKDKTRPTLGNPKTLNFDPIVNLFDAQSPHGVQLPLSRMSSSDESGSPPNTSTFSSHPLSLKPSVLPQQDQNHLQSNITNESREAGQGTKGMSKYQPTFRAPGSKPARPASMTLSSAEVVMASSTPITDRQSSSSGSGRSSVQENHDSTTPHNKSSDLSAIHSISSPSIASIDSFDVSLPTPLNKYNKSGDTLSSSNSTIALSDFDSSSLTHVSLTDSTPSGSTLSLNWDTDNTPNPTPMATPMHKRASLNSLSSTNMDSNKSNNSSSNTDGCVDNTRQYNVPSASKSTVFPSSSSSSSTSSSYDHKYGSQSSNSFPFADIHPDSDPSLIASNLQSGSNQPAMPYSSNANSVSAIPVQSPGASDSANDNNNNNNKNSKPMLQNSAMSNVRSRNTDHSPHSLPHSQSWSAAPPHADYSSRSHYQQSSSSSVRPSQNERRRSSPVMSQTRSYYYSSSSHSGQEDSSGGSGQDNNVVKRRRSGNDLQSPDSGFDSPSAVNQQFPYSSHSSQHQKQFPISQSYTNSSKVPQIKQPMFMDPKSAYSDFVPKQGSANGGSAIRGDYPVRAQNLNSSSSHSNESLSSQGSGSSAQQLLPGSRHKTDLSHPVLQRGNSSESVHSNSSAGRSDSYRVAMMCDSDEVSLIPDKKSNASNFHQSSDHRRNSYNHVNKPSSMSHAPLMKSLSTPAPAVYNDDSVNRADSYRCAVRNTQSAILGDMAGRNSSYRLATMEDDVVFTDNRMDACNLWTGKSGNTRDMRRMGITDVDQLKQYSHDPNGSSRSGSRHGPSKPIDIHSKKKLGIKSDSDMAKSPPSDHKRFMRSNSKDKSKQKTQSSTYIRFDPIFESGEDLRASSESLRPPSIVSIKTLAKAESNDTLISENAHLIGQKGPTSPPRRRSGSQGRRSTDDKSGLSIFGSIKTTIKSIGGGKGD